MPSLYCTGIYSLELGIYKYVQLLFVFSLLDNDSVDTDIKQGEQESDRTLKYVKVPYRIILGNLWS